MKLSRASRKLVSTLALALAATAANAQDASKLPDFSATQVTQAMGRDMMPWKIYSSGSKLRVEPTEKASTIYLPDENKAYNLFPGGACVVMRTDQVTMMPSPLQLISGPKIERTPEGTEVVEGHACHVEKVVVTGTNGKTVESKVWRADDLKGVPVKIESHTDHGIFSAIYRDIVIGTPDPALFTPPGKCTPYEKMGQVAP